MKWKKRGNVMFSDIKGQEWYAFHIIQFTKPFDIFRNSADKTENCLGREQMALKNRKNHNYRKP